MASEATIETVIDRRRLRRKLTFWRLLTFVVLAAALIGLLYATGTFRSAMTAVAPHIARVDVAGVITEDRKLIELLDRVGKSDAVQGVILRVDSPGGTSVGGEAIYEAVRRLAERKPTTASVGTLAASAGYMVAAGTDHIVARNTSIVGSIGVIVQVPQIAGLLDKIGVEVREIRSTPLKAQPSPFSETTPDEEAMIRRVIDSSYAWLVDLVAERRPFDRAQALRLADGSVYSGLQAKELQLIDAIGGEDVARAWLTTKGVDENLKIVDWKPANPTGLFGLDSIARPASATDRALAEEVKRLRRLVPERLFLDGLLSIWQ